MKFGLLAVGADPAGWIELAQEAETLGFESFWVWEHLILPVGGTGSPMGEDHPPIPPQTPLYDPLMFLAAIAARTSTIRLGTHVYNIGLRHPFVTARSVTTLDIISGGRFELGIGVSWNPQEVAAAGVDFATRGRRVNETLEVCQRLWSEPVIEHHGEFIDFPPVMFEPKPVQKPWPKIHVGGDSEIALKRAALRGDGWCPTVTWPVERLADGVARLQQMRAEAGRTGPFEVSPCAEVNSHDEIARFADAGADRLLVRPYATVEDGFDGLRLTGAKEAIAGARRFAEKFL